MDLIDRQAAINALLHNQELYSNGFGNDPIDRYTIAIIDNDVQTIAQLSSAQRKGKWVYEKINSYTSRTYCSECGNPAPFICVSGDYYGRNMHGETKKTKFCPNCGLSMEVEE